MQNDVHISMFWYIWQFKKQKNEYIYFYKQHTSSDVTQIQEIYQRPNKKSFFLKKDHAFYV